MEVSSAERIIEALRSLGSVEAGGGSVPPPLPPNDGGGTFEGMEPRIAKLEADMATVKERLNHLPTKLEVRDLIDTSLEKTATRVQRNIGVWGGLAALALAAITIGSKFIG